MKTLEKPRTEPYGDIIRRDINYSPDGACFIGDNYDLIPTGHCRICGKKIRHYKEIYFQKHFENGCRYCFRLSEADAYCKECAQAEGSKEQSTPGLPKESRRYEALVEGDYVTVWEYEDGSVMRSLSLRERMRSSVRI